MMHYHTKRLNEMESFSLLKLQYYTSPFIIPLLNASANACRSHIFFDVFLPASVSATSRRFGAFSIISSLE